MKSVPHAFISSNFNQYGKLNTVLVGYHYGGKWLIDDWLKRMIDILFFNLDLNFRTIHGKWRFADLYILLKDDEKCLFDFPMDACPDRLSTST